MSIGFIIGMIVIVLTSIGIIIYGIYRIRYGFTGIFLLIIGCLSLILVPLAMLSDSSTINKAIKKIDMERTYIDVNTSRYEKGNLKVEYKNSTYRNYYTITDKEKFNLRYHELLINSFFDLQEGAIQRIYAYLVEYSQNLNNNAYLTIIDNHTKLEIEYQYLNKAIVYKIEEVKNVLDEYEDYDETKRIIRKNNSLEYKTLYVKPELLIKHYNNLENNDVDGKLLELIFNKKRNLFNRKIENDTIIYQYSYAN